MLVSPSLSKAHGIQLSLVFGYPRWELNPSPWRDLLSAGPAQDGNQSRNQADAAARKPTAAADAQCLCGSV